MYLEHLFWKGGGNLQVAGDYIYWIHEKNIDASTTVSVLCSTNINTNEHAELMPLSKYSYFFINGNELWLHDTAVSGDYDTSYDFSVYSLSDISQIIRREEHTKNVIKHGKTLFDGNNVYCFTLQETISRRNDERIINGYIYYSDHGYGLFKYNLATGEDTQLNNDDPIYVIVWGDGYVYYLMNDYWGNGNRTIYRVCTDGTGWEPVDWLYNPEI